MNKVTVFGRLTADPTMGTTSGGIDYANFTLACDTRTKDADGNNITNFYRMTAWRGLAEVMVKNLHKGDPLVVMGDLTHRTYKDKNGVDRWDLSVSITDFNFVPTARRTSGNQQAPQAPESRQDELDELDEIFGS